MRIYAICWWIAELLTQMFAFIKNLFCFSGTDGVWYRYFIYHNFEWIRQNSPTSNLKFSYHLSNNNYVDFIVTAINFFINPVRDIHKKYLIIQNNYNQYIYNHKHSAFTNFAYLFNQYFYVRLLYLLSILASNFFTQGHRQKWFYFFLRKRGR